MYNIGSTINPLAHAAWHYVPDVFTDVECDQIVAIDDQSWESVVKTHPDGSTSNIPFKPLYANDHSWIFDRLAKVVSDVNSRVWKFQIEGFFEDGFRMQYKDGAHESWHYDLSFPIDGVSIAALRKLTVDVQLTDPHTYGGCDFRPFGMDWDGWETRKPRGSIIIRPSYFMYEVSPCYQGQRDIIRAFVHGQHFS